MHFKIKIPLDKGPVDAAVFRFPHFNTSHYRIGQNRIGIVANCPQAAVRERNHVSREDIGHSSIIKIRLTEFGQITVLQVFVFARRFIKPFVEDPFQIPRANILIESGEISKTNANAVSHTTTFCP